MTSNQVPEEYLRNPYVHRGAIKDAGSFFGRVEETREILRYTTRGQSVSIVGPRRIGKTSLLLHLRRSAPKVVRDNETRHLYLFLDCQRKYEASESDIYRWMWNEVLKEAGGTEEPHTTIGSAEEFERAVGELCADGSKLTLLLDEFELMAANPQLDIGFFSHLRSLTVTHPVGFMTSSRKPLLDLEYSDRSVLGSPFFSIFDQLRLGFLKQEEARSMVLDQVQDIEDFPGYTEKDFDFLFDIAGCHPAFLEIACYHVFERKMTGEEWSDQAEKDVRQEYKDEVVSHFYYAWRQLTSEQQEAMILVCKGQGDQVKDPLWDQLGHHCLVYGRRPFSSVFREFLLQEGVEEMRGAEQPPTDGITQPKKRASVPVLDVSIGILVLLTVAGLVFSALFRAPNLLYISAVPLCVTVILLLVRSLIK
jgi:hypothetical protein